MADERTCDVLCDEFRNRLQRLLDDRRQPERDNGLRGHAAECRRCRHVLRAQAELFAGLATADVHDPPRDLARRVLSELNQTDSRLVSPARGSSNGFRANEHRTMNPRTGAQRSNRRGSAWHDRRARWIGIAAAAGVLIATAPLAVRSFFQMGIEDRPSVVRTAHDAAADGAAPHDVAPRGQFLAPTPASRGAEDGARPGDSVNSVRRPTSVRGAGGAPLVYSDVARELGQSVASGMVYFPGVGTSAASITLDEQIPETVAVGLAPLRPLRDSMAAAMGLLRKTLPHATTPYDPRTSS
jgi:hypothetical protein